MKTSELIGPALDWAVAKCEELDFEIDAQLQNYPHIMQADKNVWGERCCILRQECGGVRFQPSIDWAQAGPIIERERIELNVSMTSGKWVARKHQPTLMHDNFRTEGKTYLIAAMRCYVSSKMGDEIEMPKELA